MTEGINGSLQLEENEVTAQLPSPCEGCIADSEHRDEIEKKLTAVQSDMRERFAKQIEEHGTCRALEEIFFREEGLETYRDLSTKLEDLADEVDELKLLRPRGEEHTCVLEELW